MHRLVEIYERRHLADGTQHACDLLRRLALRLERQQDIRNVRASHFSGEHGAHQCMTLVCGQIPTVAEACDDRRPFHARLAHEWLRLRAATTLTQQAPAFLGSGSAPHTLVFTVVESMVETR